MTENKGDPGEAGILPTELLPLSGRSKYSKDSVLRARAKMGQPENPRFSHLLPASSSANKIQCKTNQVALKADSKIDQGSRCLG